MTVIDSLEFARSGRSLRARLPVAELHRLHDSLADALGEIEFIVTGGSDSRHRPVLSLDVSGTLRLQCQRCLEALDYPLRLSNTLLLVGAAEAEAGDYDAEELEWIVASAALDVAVLVEDEILLSLPYSPRHEASDCRLATGAPQGAGGAAAVSRLGALKRTDH
jgi:uncharacterized protein